jgi:hypothetical protein
LLFAGEIVNWSSLEQMQRTVPVISFERKRPGLNLREHIQEDEVVCPNKMKIIQPSAMRMKWRVVTT